MKVKDIIQRTEWLPNPQISQEQPRFSILMPTYRRYASGHLTRAIQSVLKQTYGNFELIVIDDGSVDGSFAEIQRFMKLDPRIHCLHHPQNVGLPAIGCYEAFLKSRGDYLMFCFDDSEYQRNALKQMEQYVSRHKPKMCFGFIDIQSLDVSGKVHHTYLGKHEPSQSTLVSINIFPNLGAILHRSVPTEIGFFDPHLAIARLTDWDYWKRAANVYELQYSRIYIGVEKGLVTGNSLGLTYPLDSWMAYEWTEQDRNDALIPGNYEEYDVQFVPENLSEQSKIALHKMSAFYAEKFWYEQKSPAPVSDFSSKGDVDRNVRLLIASSAQTASVTLAFEFIHTDHTLRYVSPNYHQPEEMISANAVIFVRDLFNPLIRRWADIARQLGVPFYYYLDDNFLVLNKENPELAKFSFENVRSALADFQGVLATSQALAAFLTENRIHPTVYHFPPVKPPTEWLDDTLIPERPTGVTRIGFMGGPHRHREFMDFVLPAIVRLAKDRAVELIVGGKYRINNKRYPQIKIYHFPFDNSYRLALGRMQSADIDILVHAGSETYNNPYKTHNILLNAWALKALPVLANQPPYENIESLGLGLLCSRPEEWYEKLRRGVSEPETVSQIQASLDRYVMENFSGRQNLEVLRAISEECPTPTLSVIEERQKRYADIVKSESQQPTKWDPAILASNSRLEALIRQNRSWLLPVDSPQERLARFIFRSYYALVEWRASRLAISYRKRSKGIVRLIHKLEYNLHPLAAGWTGFEFMVGTHNRKAAGELNVQILDVKTRSLVHHQVLDLNDIHDNQTIKIRFDPIHDSQGKDFKVVFLLRRSDPNTLISIYEDNLMESKPVRALRRMGLLTRGNVLACRLLYGDA